MSQDFMVLFVCSQAFLRSRTAEILCVMGGVDARCCGTGKDAMYPANIELLWPAEIIFCMEQKHKDHLMKMAPQFEHRMVVLNIPDDYERYDPELVSLLVSRTAALDERVSLAIDAGYQLWKRTLAHKQ